jgi:hypothetical protein
MDENIENKKRKVDDMKDLLAKVARLQAQALADAKENARLQEENTRLEKESLAKSLLSVLPGGGVDNPMPLLDLRGTNKSHLRSKNKAAVVTYEPFTVPDVRAADRDLGLGLKNKVSSIRTVITNSNRTLRYENEYDVHGYVHQGLHDATLICNEIIANQALANHSKPTLLDVRRESVLFSSILNHVVVFDVVSGVPVFSVETKKVWDKLPEGVFGQVYV